MNIFHVFSLKLGPVFAGPFLLNSDPKMGKVIYAVTINEIIKCHLNQAARFVHLKWC